MNPSIQSLQDASARGQQWFAALEMRERVMVVACAIVVVIAALFLGVWEPLVKSRGDRLEALDRARSLSDRIEHAAILAGNSNQASAPGGNASLLAAIDQSSKQEPMNKAPSRIQPQGDREVRVWFEDVSFDASVQWLARLQTQYGIQVQSLDIEPESAPGRVKFRASLVRPS